MITPPVHDGPGDLARFTDVAVTGGQGFVGRHLVRALHALGKTVTVVDNAPSGDVPAGCRVRSVDLRDADRAADALRGADLVFHLAGNASGTVSVEDPRFDFGANAVTTFNVAAALVGTDTRLVSVSTAMVYGRPRASPVPEDHALAPFIPYAGSKLAGEVMIRALVETYGLAAVVVRSFTVYGPGEDPRRAGGEVSQYLRWHLRGLPVPVVGDLDRKTRDFVHVTDMVRGLLVAADRGVAGEVYNVGSGREYSLRDLLAVLAAATGRVPAIDHAPEVGDDTYRMVADIGKLGQLGYRPEIDLEAGVRALAAELGDLPELPSVRTVFRADPHGRPTALAGE